MCCAIGGYWNSGQCISGYAFLLIECFCFFLDEGINLAYLLGNSHDCP